MAHDMSLVYANTTDSSEGAAFDLPVRTLWPAVFDHGERSIMAKFYMRDGPGELPAGGPELMFTARPDVGVLGAEEHVETG